MKKLLSILAVSALSYPVCIAQQNAVLAGKIINPKDRNVSVIYTVDYLCYRDTTIEAPLAKDGSFSITVPLRTADAIYFRHADERTELYLEPGDAQSLSLDTKTFDASVKYTGKGSANSNFMALEFLRFGGHEKAVKEQKKIRDLDYEAYSSFLDELYTQKRHCLDSAAGLSEGFYKYSLYEITYKRAYDLLAYPGMHAYYKKEKSGTAPPAKLDRCKEVLKETGVQNDDALRSMNYMQYISSYVSAEIGARDHNYEDMNHKVFYMAGEFVSGNSLEYVQAAALNDAFSNENISGYEKEWANFKTSTHNPEYVKSLQVVYEKAAAFLPGKPAPAFTLKDAQGKTRSLADMKGKVIYIDFWATWCGPCLNEMPSAKELEEKFSKEHDLVFIKISIDEDIDAWHKKLKKENLGGINLIDPKGFKGGVAEKYNVTGIPDFFLIDRNGNFIQAHAPRPSTGEELEKLISTALKQ